MRLFRRKPKSVKDPTYGAKYPHCDELVLHRPGTCWACDLYPQQQRQRVIDGINFTGEHDPAKQTCPAEQRRSAEKINRWPGNQAAKEPRSYP